MRCAVIMPHVWRGGMARFAVLLSNILSELEFEGERCVVSLCVPSGYDISNLHGVAESVNVIHMDLIAISKSDFRYRSYLPRWDDDVSPDTYTFPHASQYALDIILADVWIMLTGLLPYGPLLPLKPYLVYAPDFIQRLVPEIFSQGYDTQQWRLSTAQNLTMQASQGVFATTERTAQDAISYAGVKGSKVHVLPMIHTPTDRLVQRSKVGSSNKEDHVRALLAQEFDATTDQSIAKDLPVVPDQSMGAIAGIGRYFLWVTNNTPHKNHVRGLQALRHYYEHEGGKLQCIICGPLTESFRPEATDGAPHLQPIRNIIAETKYMSGQLVIAGEVSEGVYQQLLRDAAFLWHNVLYDNGTFSVIEASELGTRSLVSEYPQMIFIAETFGINVNTFDPWDVADTASKLKAMEQSLIEDGITPTFKDPGDLRGRFKLEIADLLRELA